MMLTWLDIHIWASAQCMCSEFAMFVSLCLSHSYAMASGSNSWFADLGSSHHRLHMLIFCNSGRVGYYIPFAFDSMPQ
ncbi:hypothetical protein N431DRAFT_188877 [Stipitochalara longipes BDJ]|nr:hypothetical protein N431DRAFT_188877 [Stipitochalara longipes BDJ]